MNSMKFSFPWNRVKLANVCNVLATRVRLRAAFSFGYSVTLQLADCTSNGIIQMSGIN